MSNKASLATVRTPRLGGAEKVAALLLAITPNAAARILKRFDRDDILQISRSATELGSVAHQELDKVIDEFLSKFSDGVSLMGSVDGVEKMLRGVLPEEDLNEIMSDVMGNSNRSIWDRISNISEQVLANYLNKEHPQTAAFILSKIKPSTAAKIMGQMPADRRNALTRRIISLKPIVESVVREAERTLHEDFLLNFARTSGSDTHARMADILNKMERAQLEEALGDLAQVRPKSAEVLKGLLFTFDDIVKLNGRSLMLVFDQVPTDRLVLALKGTNEGFREIVLGSLTARARRIVQAELATGAPSTQKEVLDARRAITDLALDLGSKGVIDLNAEDERATFY
ncbi:flagellar motor switch protein FliG [Chthonobacter rhizosphaerae]|uniref:flagellar motor switch protein FliG n=1 Tax=Chthonobacter rhizosphaerae TaxID=2735553 RepID=UPI0015EE8A1D|nr:flagellar motor switch protein FliG [Chthonobacter rhizosphaerae]